MYADEIADLAKKYGVHYLNYKVPSGFLTNFDTFKKRVALLTEKGVSDYNRIIEYYKIRNKIGHGEIISDIGSEINMINVFMDMRLFFKKLRP